MVVVPVVIMVIMVVMVMMLFIALEWILGHKFQISAIDSYGGGIGIVCGNRTSVMMVVVVAMVAMLFVALQRVLELQFQLSRINPYICDNRTSVELLSVAL